MRQQKQGYGRYEGSKRKGFGVETYVLSDSDDDDVQIIEARPPPLTEAERQRKRQEEADQRERIVMQKRRDEEAKKAADLQVLRDMQAATEREDAAERERLRKIKAWNELLKAQSELGSSEEEQLQKVIDSSQRYAPASSSSTSSTRPSSYTQPTRPLSSTPSATRPLSATRPSSSTRPPSPLTNHVEISNGLYVDCLIVQDSSLPGAGKGVFTTRSLEEGTLIGRYKGVDMKSTQSDKRWMTPREHKNLKYKKEDYRGDPTRFDYVMADHERRRVVDGHPMHGGKVNEIALINSIKPGVANQKHLENVMIVNSIDAMQFTGKGGLAPGVYYVAMKDIRVFKSGKNKEQPVELIVDYGSGYHEDPLMERERQMAHQMTDLGEGEKLPGWAVYGDKAWPEARVDNETHDAPAFNESYKRMYYEDREDGMHEKVKPKKLKKFEETEWGDTPWDEDMNWDDEVDEQGEEISFAQEMHMEDGELQQFQGAYEKIRKGDKTMAELPPEVRKKLDKRLYGKPDDGKPVFGKSNEKIRRNQYDEYGHQHDYYKGYKKQYSPQKEFSETGEVRAEHPLTQKQIDDDKKMEWESFNNRSSEGRGDRPVGWVTIKNKHGETKVDNWYPGSLGRVQGKTVHPHRPTAAGMKWAGYSPEEVESWKRLEKNRRKAIKDYHTDLKNNKAAQAHAEEEKKWKADVKAAVARKQAAENERKAEEKKIKAAAKQAKEALTSEKKAQRAAAKEAREKEKQEKQKRKEEKEKEKEKMQTFTHIPKKKPKSQKSRKG